MLKRIENIKNVTFKSAYNKIYFEHKSQNESLKMCV